jgi:hypothetical protein
MTKDEALRLALEALENYDGQTWEETKETITAIKAALLSRSDGEAQTRSVVKDEPVAWRDAAIRLGEELSSVGPYGYYDMDAKKWLDWAMKQNPRGEHSLPQRTWVGLTDDDRVLIKHDANYNQFMTAGEYAERVQLLTEARLKDKNT